MSRSAIGHWLRGFMPGPVAIKWPERFRSCLGALIGIAFTGSAIHLLPGSASAIPFLVAPMGASAVLLFAVPASPLAQPWSIIGGNLVSATVGVACAALIANPVCAAAFAVALAIGFMFALRCVHPPSGAVALTAVLGGPAVHAMGFGFVIAPIAFQSGALLAAAIVYHAVTGHRYPHAVHHAPAPDENAAVRTSSPGITRADIQAVLDRRDELLDIDPDDLESLMRDTQMLAYARTFRDLACADIMSTPVVTVAASELATSARDLLKRHDVKALPVTDDAQRVIGIVTRSDLMDKYSAATGFEVSSITPRWLKRSTGPVPLVRSLMSSHVRTVDASATIADLVPIFATYGHHHIPVLNADKKLAGMITQSDLLAGLYRQAHVEQLRTRETAAG
ncbi:HPP family protein [Caballeronia sordidicola]|nr:HPP family protein [Caballeronia sordidicola]